MEPSTRNSWISLWNFIRRLLSKSIASPRQPIVPADNLFEPAKIITSQVLLVVYDPVMDPVTGNKLTTLMKWNSPGELVNVFIRDILQSSHGMARFQVVERVELNAFPILTNGYQYTPQTYLEVINNINAPQTPPKADYPAILSQLDVPARITKREIDEVWLFAFPYAGFYESTMAGPQAFWCNAPPVATTGNTSRRFITMGFSYERGVGEMLESFGHRTESILERTFAHTTGPANLYAKFSRYDKKYPGKAEVGNIHFAPNSEAAYDWGNARMVVSACDDWFNFPASTGIRREVNASEWGNGDIRKHHTWWLSHIPHGAGRTNGVHNNWWQYIMDPNLVVP